MVATGIVPQQRASHSSPQPHAPHPPSPAHGRGTLFLYSHGGRGDAPRVPGAAVLLSTLADAAQGSHCGTGRVSGSLPPLAPHPVSPRLLTDALQLPAWTGLQRDEAQVLHGRGVRGAPGREEARGQPHVGRAGVPVPLHAARQGRLAGLLHGPVGVGVMRGCQEGVSGSRTLQRGSWYL